MYHQLCKEKSFCKTHSFQVGDGPAKTAETRQGWKHTRRLPYYVTMAVRRQEELHAADVHACHIKFGPSKVVLHLYNNEYINTI